jgi:nucleotide-binding universal stress UspA family protein
MRVLVATDGSPSAEMAVDFVAGLAWPEGSEIRVAEAIETGTAIFGGPWPAIAVVQAEELEAELQRTAGDNVNRARDRLQGPGREVAVEVLRGRPATAIIEAAKTFRADVIVLGSRGHGTIESMLLGSVSAEVVDHATVPVLVARGRSAKRVVFAWDGSTSARAAADLLRAWPIFAGSRVRVVSVADVRMPWWAGMPGPETPELLPLYFDAANAARRSHDALASEMTAELRSAGLDATADRRDGDPATEVIASAQSTDADLIVLGTHGRTGLARLMLGSVARNVLQHAHCSVLVARQHAAADEPPADRG